MGAKLTAAQWRELKLLGGADHRLHYVESYKPIQALWALGYVERQNDRHGSCTWAITPAGRQALAEASGSEGEKA